MCALRCGLETVVKDRLPFVTKAEIASGHGRPVACSPTRHRQPTGSHGCMPDSPIKAYLGVAWRSMAETWLRSIRKALWGTATVSCVAMRVKMRSVRPTVASAAGTNDLHTCVWPFRLWLQIQGGTHIAPLWPIKPSCISTEAMSAVIAFTCSTVPHSACSFR